MTVPFGWMYDPLVKKNPAEEILIVSATGAPVINVGEEIIPIELSQYHIGGVGPYTYAPTNNRLPSGITVNGSTGKVSGVYSSATAEGTSQVIVRDSLGNTLTLDIAYRPGQIPLTFMKKSLWDFGYLEVDVSIPDDRDLSTGVTGGYLSKDGAYRFFLEDDAPDGIKITTDGKLYGRPTVPLPPGSFTVTVRDDQDSSRSIKVSYNSILPSFRFEARPKENLPIQHIWIPSSMDTSLKEPEEIILQTILVGIDVKPYVSGGLPFTSGPAYTFTAIGLLPDWEITRDGILKGKARTSMAAHEATLIAQDARGEKRTCVIKVGEVKGGIEYRGQPLEFTGLYVGSEINNSNITTGTLVLSKDLFYPAEVEYEIHLEGAPSGINIRKIETYDQRQEWEFYGTPLQAGTSRTGWLSISDKDGHSLRVQINFGPVTERLQWNKEEPMSIFGAAGIQVERAIEATGGMPEFTIDYGGPAAQYIEVVPGNTNNISTYRLRFNLPEISKYDDYATVTITDGHGTKITKTFNIQTAATKIKLEWLADFRSVTVMAKHAVFKDVPVMKISGGMGGYKIVEGDSIGNGNLMFKVLNNQIVVTGTPTDEISTHIDWATKLVVTDRETSGTVSPSQSIMGPVVVPQPSIGKNIKDNVLRRDGLLYLQSYTSPDLFNDLQFPGIQITD